MASFRARSFSAGREPMADAQGAAAAAAPPKASTISGFFMRRSSLSDMPPQPTAALPGGEENLNASSLKPRSSVAEQLRRIKERASNLVVGKPPIKENGGAAPVGGGKPPIALAKIETPPAVLTAQGKIGSLAPAEPRQDEPALEMVPVISPPSIFVPIGSQLLSLEVRLPAPAPLPPVEHMSTHDCLRELMAVACQRDAETAAAITVFERYHQAMQQQQQRATAMATARTSMNRYPPLPSSAVKDKAGSQLAAAIEGPAKVGSDAAALTGSVSIAAYTSSATGSSQPGGLTLQKTADGSTYETVRSEGVTVSAKVINQQAQQHQQVDIGAAVAAAMAAPSLKPAGDGTGSSVLSLTIPPHTLPSGAVRPAVQLSVHIPAALAPLLTSSSAAEAIASATGVLAFCIPRRDAMANVPSVGPAASADAVTTLKSLLRSLASSASISEAERIAGALATSGDSNDSISLLRSFCRVWPHAQLTPAQSQLRVQALVARVREEGGGFEVTPPQPPLAPTRLGSGHVSVAHTSANITAPAAYTPSSKSQLLMTSPLRGSTSITSAMTPSSSNRGRTAAMAHHHHVPESSVFAGTQQIASAHGGAASTGPYDVSGGTAGGSYGFSTPVKSPHGSSSGARAGAPLTTVTPVVLGSSSRPGRPMVTFTFTGGGSFVSPRKGGAHGPTASAAATARVRFSANGSPAATTGAPHAAFSASGGPRVLARYVDGVLDCTRAGASPASFDREAHRGVLQKLEAGLHAMSAQRRAEEEHMRTHTGIKPAKHPKGGYWYQDICTEREVHPHDYEAVYLDEVAYGSDYIVNATKEAWEQEAIEKNAAAAALPPAVRAAEAARIAREKAARVSWWAQDIEEGYVYNSSNNSVPDVSSSSAIADVTVGSVLQRLVRGWAASESARVEGEMKAAVVEHIRSAKAAEEAATAASVAAARALAEAAAAASAPPQSPSASVVSSASGGSSTPTLSVTSASSSQLEVTRIVGGGPDDAVDDDEVEEEAMSGSILGSLETSLGAIVEPATAPLTSPAPVSARSSVTGISSSSSSSSTFSLGQDGAFELFTQTSTQTGSDSARSISGTTSASAGPISVADVLSDAMQSLNASARDAARFTTDASGSDSFLDCSVTSDVSGSGGCIDDLLPVPEAERAFIIATEDEGEEAEESAGAGDEGDVATEAALNFVRASAGRGSNAGISSASGPFSPVPKMVLPPLEDDAPVAAVGGDIISTTNAAALEAPVTPRGVTDVSLGGNPFGGICMQMLPSEGVDGAATAAEGEEAGGPESEAEAAAAGSIAASLGAETDDEAAAVIGGIRPLGGGSLSELFARVSLHGSDVIGATSAASGNSDVTIRAAIQDAVSHGSPAAVPTLVFDKETGEATMAMVTIGVSASPYTTAAAGFTSATAPSSDSPVLGPSALGSGGAMGGAGALSDDIHSPDAFIPIQEAIGHPLSLTSSAATASGGTTDVSESQEACAIPIPARVGPFSPVRQREAQAAREAAAAHAAALLMSPPKHASPPVAATAAGAAPGGVPALNLLSPFEFLPQQPATGAAAAPSTAMPAASPDLLAFFSPGNAMTMTSGEAGGAVSSTGPSRRVIGPGIASYASAASVGRAAAVRAALSRKSTGTGLAAVAEGDAAAAAAQPEPSLLSFSPLLPVVTSSGSGAPMMVMSAGVGPGASAVSAGASKRASSSGIPLVPTILAATAAGSGSSSSGVVSRRLLLDEMDGQQ